MDKIKLLQERRGKLLEAGKGIREDIFSIADRDSFVELSTYSFSESEFYGDKAEGEGVVCGFCSVDGCGFYVVAQNFAVLDGGVSKANCNKIVKCLDMAEKSGTPVIYLISTLGVRVGEGVNVLEGLAELLVKASRLKDSVTQYLVVNGEAYGQIAILAGLCDFNFFIEGKSVLALNSPLVIGAGKGNLPKEKVGGPDALKKTGLTSFVVKDLKEVKSKIVALQELLEVAVEDCDDLNGSLPALNKKADLKALLSVFDKGSAIEVGASFAGKIKCYLARMGGIAVACAIFDGEEPVKICPCMMGKLNDFASLASAYSLPFITFVNTAGVKEELEVADSRLVKLMGEYVATLDYMNSPKISVVCGKAIGLGYTLFAAKNMGYDFTYALANSEIALFDGAQGAEIELAGSGNADVEKLKIKYCEENADPVNAAKGGYVDNIIEPAFLRQYLIASLQMLVK